MRAIKIIKVAALFVATLTGVAYAEQNWTEFVAGYDEGTAPIINVISSDGDSTVVEITTPGMWVEVVEVDDTTFHKIELPECGFMYEIGKPQIPVVTTLIAVPGMKGISLTIIDTDSTTLEGYNVYPFQTPLVDENGGNPGFDYDEEFYQMDALYPENLMELGGASIWRDLRVVNPDVHPARFNPGQQELEVTYYIKFELEYSGESEDNVKEDADYPIEEMYADAYRENVVNYDYLGLAETDWQLDGLDYLIITTPPLVSKANEIRDWVRRRGYGAQTVDTNTAGDTWQEIWAYLKNRYAAEKMDYVLLVGDANLVDIAKVTVFIPMWSEYITYSTDYRYSLLSGDDPWPDVALARLSIITPAGLENQINKIFDYNSGVEPGQWPRWHILVTHKEGERFYAIKEKIRDYGWPKFAPLFKNCYGNEYGPPTNTELKNWIDDGRGYVNYRGHGDINCYSGWCYGEEDGSWWVSDVRNLDNGEKYLISFNIGCWMGKIDHSNECLCESWLNAEHAAVAALGATERSWTYTNNVFDGELYKQIFYYGKTRLGRINNDARGCFVKFHKMGDPYGTASLFQFLLLGEPTTIVRTGALFAFDVVHESSVSVGPATVEVEVYEEEGATEVEGAVVCLYKDDDVHEAYTTDTDGLASFDIETDGAGEITVTVTRHGFIPYEATITVE